MCRETARSGRELREAVDRLTKACGECIGGDDLRHIYAVPQDTPDWQIDALQRIDAATKGV